jgi:oxygen-independent coproporphyrinogen-3 oxidase
MKTLGLYIHIPFCVQKCLYCDFVSYAGKEAMIPRYIDAVLKEACLYSRLFSSHTKDTVFLGGGTPACLPEGGVLRLLAGLRERFHIDKDAEITIEANPGVLTAAKLDEYRRAGVSRISIGMQSHDDALLKTLGRIHTHADFTESFRLAREAGFSNISADVMFGLPGQTVQGFEATIGSLVSLKPEHVSAYALKVEKGTPFYKTYGDTPVLGEAAERAMYHAAVRMLKNAGYGQYETSNFALKGFACRHNLKYWTQGEYLGLGAAAHSYFEEEGGFVRQENPKSLGEYLAAVEAGKEAACKKEALGESDMLAEYIMLRLRLAQGIDYRDFERRFGFGFNERFKKEIATLKKARLIREDAAGVKPLLKGFDLQNALIVEFIKNI